MFGKRTGRHCIKACTEVNQSKEKPAENQVACTEPMKVLVKSEERDCVSAVVQRKAKQSSVGGCAY